MRIDPMAVTQLLAEVRVDLTRKKPGRLACNAAAVERTDNG